jgi:predicted dehydrogenase
MDKTRNIAVIGCGYWGPNLIRNFRAQPGCIVKTICDLSQERLDHIKGLYPEVEATSDVRCQYYFQ